MKLEKRLGELREIWPSLEWCSARLLEHDHDVVILDETLVFRFQCKNPLHEPLQPEIKFLKAVRRSVEIALPNYTHVDPCYRVAGYPKLPGEPLTLTAFACLTNREKKCLAKSLGEFLKTIHRFSTNVASSFGIREMQPLGQQMAQALYYYRQLLAWDSLTRNERRWYEGTTASTMDSLSQTNSPLSQVVVRDLSIGHLLTTDGRLSGIIDFGDVALGDPAADLAYLWVFGEHFVDTALETYNSEDPQIKPRSLSWWLAEATRLLQYGAHQQHSTIWNHGYRVFPPDIADEDRAFGYW